MINVLATLTMTVAVVSLIGFVLFLVKASKVEPLRLLRAAVTAMCAIALVSDKFANGNILLAVLSFAMVALNVIVNLVDLFDDFSNKKLGSMFSELIVDSICVIAGIVLINIR